MTPKTFIIFFWITNMNCNACKYFYVSVFGAAVHYLWKTTKFTNSSFDKMAKHTQTIRRQIADELFERVWLFC